MSAKSDKPRASGTKRHDPETRERALVLADRHGAAEAARRTGVAAGTIRRWRHQTASSAPAGNADAVEWEHRKREAASEIWVAAREALVRVRELLGEGGARAERDAKDAALTLAILLDKSAALEQASALADERQASLTEAQGQAIAGALAAVSDDLGLPPDAAVRRVFAHHLRALAYGVKPGPAPTSEAARAAIRSCPPEEKNDEDGAVPAREKLRLALRDGDPRH